MKKILKAAGKVIRTILVILCFGSGLTSGKGLLWWHPAVILFAIIVVVSEILQGIWDTCGKIYRTLKREKWRTLPL